MDNRVTAILTSAVRVRMPCRCQLFDNRFTATPAQIFLFAVFYTRRFYRNRFRTVSMPIGLYHFRIGIATTTASIRSHTVYRTSRHRCKHTAIVAMPIRCNILTFRRTAVPASTRFCAVFRTSCRRCRCPRAKAMPSCSQRFRIAVWAHVTVIHFHTIRGTRYGRCYTSFIIVSQSQNRFLMRFTARLTGIRLYAIRFTSRRGCYFRYVIVTRCRDSFRIFCTAFAGFRQYACFRTRCHFRYTFMLIGVYVIRAERESANFT